MKKKRKKQKKKSFKTIIDENDEQVFCCCASLLTGSLFGLMICEWARSGIYVRTLLISSIASGEVRHWRRARRAQKASAFIFKLSPRKKNEINDEWTDDGSREKTWWFPFTTLARRSLKSLFAALRMCTIICMEINYGGSLRFSWKLHKFGLRKDRASEEREGSHQAKGRPFSQWH